MTSTEKMQAIAKMLDEKKANNIKVLKVADLTLLADYFVICSANSTTGVKSLSDNIQEMMEEKGENPVQKEGKQGLNWILLDYSDVIVHIFYQETREFYGLEKLWADAEEIDINSVIGE